MEKEKQYNKFEDPKYRDLVRRTVAKGATDDELDEFLYYAQARGLDPMLKQIYLIIRSTRNPQTGLYENKATIQTSIEGLRMIAARTGYHAGTEREVLYDENGKIKGATARVYRSDWKVPATETVSFWEYAQRGRDGQVAGLWATKPETMIKKVAEAAALRLAFPAELGGMYEFSEMDAAEGEIITDVTPRSNPSNSSGKPQPEAKPEENKAAEKADVLGDMADLGDDLPPVNEPINESTQKENNRTAEVEPQPITPSETPRWITGKFVGDMWIENFNFNGEPHVCFAIAMDNGAKVLFPEKHPIIEKKLITEALNTGKMVSVLTWTWGEFEAIAGNTGKEMKEAKAS
ncbi:phage recombination protein Bet [Aneurinibacillus thermoaerophilus]|uniref:phage recombination protein Bet n=1 Tax=Aneurinibacillus thermoaerophilus TaxID=143495 RepID=UPI002E20253F|nr:phage recombination protein Bet [Aneurinibacillus thermoaerophilus]MED0738950.1 phage recombination protein Bet [Aneurinibacillus thermoaerophilus]